MPTYSTLSSGATESTDRKSTRLNSSHSQISYAVFCLKKKNFDAAQVTLVGIELMHMIKKKQLIVKSGDAGRTAVEQIYPLAAYYPPRQAQLPLHHLL